MALLAGDATCAAGTLSKAIYDGILAQPLAKAKTGDELKALSAAIAIAVVEHLKSNAVVNSTGLFAPPGTAGGPVTGASTIT